MALVINPNEQVTLLTPAEACRRLGGISRCRLDQLVHQGRVDGIHTTPAGRLFDARGLEAERERRLSAARHRIELMEAAS